MPVRFICHDEEGYPARLPRFLGDGAPESITALGSFGILGKPALALFCSVKCPGSLILQTYDLACALRDAGMTVISGFHSPMEKECLRLLLRGKQPVIVCPAHCLPKRLPAEWKQPLADGRMLLLSPFNERQARITAEQAPFRNRFVAALANEVFIGYAAPDSKTAAFTREIGSWGKSLFTLDAPENAGLLALGAKPLRPHDLGPLAELLPRRKA